jgi:hypothetical protein
VWEKECGKESVKESVIIIVSLEVRTIARGNVDTGAQGAAPELAGLQRQSGLAPGRRTRVQRLLRVWSLGLPVQLPLLQPAQRQPRSPQGSTCSHQPQRGDH